MSGNGIQVINKGEMAPALKGVVLPPAEPGLEVTPALDSATPRDYFLSQFGLTDAEVSQNVVVAGEYKPFVDIFKPDSKCPVDVAAKLQEAFQEGGRVAVQNTLKELGNFFDGAKNLEYEEITPEDQRVIEASRGILELTEVADSQKKTPN